MSDGDVMGVLDLLADVAYHDGDQRDLAVVDEAFSLAGFAPGAMMPSHAGGHQEVLRRIAKARHRRNQRLLRADARGLLWAVRALVAEGLIDFASASGQANQRWIARGGHEKQLAAAGLCSEEEA